MVVIRIDLMGKHIDILIDDWCPFRREREKIWDIHWFIKLRGHWTVTIGPSKEFQVPQHLRLDSPERPCFAVGKRASCSPHIGSTCRIIADQFMRLDLCTWRIEYDSKGITRFLCKEDVSSDDSHRDLRHNLKKTITAHVVFGDSASMFGEDAKTYTTKPSINSLTSEFRRC
jgi:hypothetical protein